MTMAIITNNTTITPNNTTKVIPIHEAKPNEPKLSVFVLLGVEGFGLLAGEVFDGGVFSG